MPPPAPSSAEPVGFPDLGRFWTVPNALTLTRVVLVAPLGWLVYIGAPLVWLVLIGGWAVLSDWLDGRIARATNTVTEWGKVLDPTADKLAAAAVGLALMVRPEEAGPSIPVWFVALVIVRDAVIAIGGMIQTRRLGYVMMALWSGKIAVALLATTLIAVLLGLDGTPRTVLLGVTTVALAFSLALYVHRFSAVLYRGLDVDERHRVRR